MDVSKAIEELRVEKKITKAEMARALEMDPSYYSKFEKRGNKLSIDQLQIIAKTLGVTIYEILAWGSKKERIKETEQDPMIRELKEKIESLYSRLEDNAIEKAATWALKIRLEANLESILLEVADELGLGQSITKEELEGFLLKGIQPGPEKTVIKEKVYTFNELFKIILYLEQEEPRLCKVLLTLFENGLLEGNYDFSYMFVSKAYGSAIVAEGYKLNKIRNKKS